MNLNQEERCGYIITQEMKKLWSVQLELLKEFVRVCNKYNLTYFLDAGTLLGAVRHQGYVPWDDDIDVIMPRKDYELLKSIGPKEFKNEYFYQNSYTDNIIRCHAQLRKNNTTCLIKQDFKKKYHKGIFIDIFPLDAVANSEEETKAFQQVLFKYYQSINYIEPKFNSPRGKLFDFIYNLSLYPLKKFKRFIKITFLGGQKKAVEKYEKMCQKYNDLNTGFCSDIAIWGTSEKKAICYQKEWFEKIVLLPFEDLNLSCPFNYDEVLKAAYGDYHKYVIGTALHGGLYFDVDHDYIKYDKLTKNEFYNLFK